MLSGDNGILQKATDAKTQTGVGQEKETIALAYNSALAKKVSNSNSSIVTDSELNDELDSSEATASGNPIIVTFTKSGNAYEIDSSGVIKPSTPKDPNASNFTAEEIAALEANGIAEITENEITNENLKNNSRIKGVITGNVPITTEMTYIEGTLDTGVVVAIGKTKTNTGNEFVWIPVPVAITSSAPSTTGVDLKTNPNIERPMAILQSGSETNYQGVLYDFSGTTSTAKSIASITGWDNREPVQLEYSDDEEWVSDSTEGGITLSVLQSEYNKMVTSVNKYGGFYVARYELGFEGTTVVSKPASGNVTTAGEGYTWYALYEDTYSMYQESESQNIVSQMIWGSQYDAMMNWMAKTGKTVGTADGDKYNQETTTGSKAEDIINNVKDLYGCNREWTQEACSTYRVRRGGYFYDSDSPASRETRLPGYGGSSYASSRSTLYIKE